MKILQTIEIEASIQYGDPMHDVCITHMTHTSRIGTKRVKPEEDADTRIIEAFELEGNECTKGKSPEQVRDRSN